MNHLNSDKNLLIIGYNSHGFVAVDIMLNMKVNITSYCDDNENSNNPFNLFYLGKEKDFFNSDSYFKNRNNWQTFIGIGNNQIRERVFNFLEEKNVSIINAVHPKTCIASSVVFGKGVMIAGNAAINPLCKIGNGVVCNTSSTIDHECIIDDFANISPGAVLNGKVQIGKRTFVGANAVIRQGIKVCNDVTIGMGACVVKDITEPGTYVGVPARRLSDK
jgi:sugar O-acyltransferase (sialic acid O-acetyltransferase NeuD family)